jgi:hypothetical protein
MVRVLYIVSAEHEPATYIPRTSMNAMNWSTI